jgi:chromosome segregation ATPase
MSSAIDL